MKKIQLLVINFDQELNNKDISKFRGAIIEKAGKEHLAFHNHLDGDKLSYAYPVIQYKTLHKKASLVCLNDGTKDINAFFSKRNCNIKVVDRKIELTIQGMNARKFNIGITS